MLPDYLDILHIFKTPKELNVDLGETEIGDRQYCIAM
jgi:hypothetical protein